jgi:hypothetical protein
MCAVHGWGAGCKCGYAVCLAALALSLGCSALASVTPSHRAQGYAAEAKAVATLCKAYRFDRAAGLVPDVPAMTELCE